MRISVTTVTVLRDFYHHESGLRSRTQEELRSQLVPCRRTPACDQNHRPLPPAPLTLILSEPEVLIPGD